MEQATTAATDEQRQAALAGRVSVFASQGWRVESQTDYQAVLVRGRRHNHLLHLILSLLTLGFWLLVWLGLVIFGGEQRVVLAVDEMGEVRTA